MKNFTLFGFIGGLVGSLVVAGLFFIVSVSITSGWFSPEGIHYLSLGNGADAVYAKGEFCTVNMGQHVSLGDAEEMWQHCLKHHEAYLSQPID